MDAQSAATVREVARRYFHRENLTVVAVGQRKGLKALERVVAEVPGLPAPEGPVLAAVSGLRG